MAPQKPFDPAIQAILEKKRSAEAKLMEGLRNIQEQEARLGRARDAWLCVANFKGDAIPRELTGKPLRRRYAELSVELGRVLRDDGWQADVDAVASGSDAKCYALEILRRAMSADTEAVLALMEASDESFWHLGWGVDNWLRYGLMYEVLHIEPLPEHRDWLIPGPFGIPFRPEIFDDLRSVSSPSELRKLCEELHRFLAPDKETRDYVTYKAPELIQELWTAMRRLGGDPPPSPAMLLRFSSRSDRVALFAAFFKGQLHDVLHPEEVLGAIDDAVRWCKCRERGEEASERENPPSIPAASADATGATSATGQGEGDKENQKGDRLKRDPNKPGKDRQNDILAAIQSAGTPLTRPELVGALRLKTEGKIGHQLAWMVSNRILVSIPQRGYWPADQPIPGMMV